MTRVFFCFIWVLCAFSLTACQDAPVYQGVSEMAVPLQIPPHVDPAAGQNPTGQSPDSVDYIVVQKKDRILSVWKQGHIVKTYTIMAMGADPVGPKVHEGDERTPEGIYFINDKHPSQHFQKFLKISYPNEDDKKLAKQRGLPVGGDVGIHGDRGGLSGFWQRFDRTWTDGCIAMRNADIEDIYNRVAVGTPIVIKP